MFIWNTTLRVRYAETDRMGYAYYGNYATYFEVARVEALRALGMSYKELEDQGVLLPVSEFAVKYKKPAYYDDEITIKVLIEEMPKIRFNFKYETYNASGVLLNTAFTQLVFVNKSSGRPMPIPVELEKMLEPHFL